jgi:hypothetical protein
LLLNVPQQAKDTLAALRKAAYGFRLYSRPDGSIFAQYSQPGKDNECGKPAAAEEARFTGEELVASHPILLENRQVATLVMRYDLAKPTSARGWSSGLFDHPADI